VSSFPRTFGRYTLLASLGRGGMGEVYAATVVGGVGGIEKRCVVKTLHASGADDREAVARFLDEARLAVRLNQRNICPVFDVGVVDGQHYLAMELVRGRDLRTLGHGARDAGIKLDTGLAVHIVSEALEGLDHAHELADEDGRPLNVVHRDVSPQNIMVSFDGDVKLIDFGLAASELKVEQTEANVVMGKIAYMPPEQVRGERAERTADVFAAAVVLYELLTGSRYYEGIAPLMLSSVVAGGAHRPTRMESLEPGLQDILRRALDPRRDRRTASAAAFADELRGWARAQGVHGDATGLRRLMRDVFGAPRDAWESANFAAQRPTTQPPLRVAGLAGFVDPDVAVARGETARRAALVTEPATTPTDDGAVQPRDATAATEIVRLPHVAASSSTMSSSSSSSRTRAVALGAAAGLVVVGFVVVGVFAVTTSRPAPSAVTTVPVPVAPVSTASAPLVAVSSASGPTGGAAAPSPVTPPPTATEIVAPMLAEPVAVPATTTATAPSSSPPSPSSPSPSPPARVRVPPRVVDGQAAALQRLDAVVDAAPLEQLKTVRAECGPATCAGVNLLDESTPARIQQCLRECRQVVRQRSR
jgi:tRNA A-37 threonylcarbamoyl transferase component Bud32